MTPTTTSTTALRSRFRAGLRQAGGFFATILFLPATFLTVLGERFKIRRLKHSKPRVIFGLTPIINIKYWSAALQAQGYDSRTVVWGWFDINRRSDFDVCLSDMLPRARGRILDPIREQLLFLWALRNGDVFFFFFDGGFLSRTPFWWLECRLLHWAGKRVAMSPFGSDIAVAGYLKPFEDAIVADYPATKPRSTRTKRMVRSFCNEIDLAIRNLQVGYLPRYDVLWPSQLAVDTERIRPVEGGFDTTSVVTVLHVANHRHIKGTDRIIQAVDELTEEGLPVRLELIEKRPNDEVLVALGRADLVIEQIIGGYGMFAIEAMSRGRPVLSNLRWMPADMKALPSIKQCPIVDCDETDLQEKLRDLIGMPSERRILGEQSRAYAERFHSFTAVGQAWAALLTHLWDREPLHEVWSTSDRALPWTPATQSSPTSSQ